MHCLFYVGCAKLRNHRNNLKAHQFLVLLEALVLVATAKVDSEARVRIRIGIIRIRIRISQHLLTSDKLHVVAHGRHRQGVLHVFVFRRFVIIVFAPFQAFEALGAVSLCTR